MFGSKAQPKQILAIDWDARTLRLVDAYVGKRGMRIDKVFSVQIPPQLDTSDPQQMGEHIRNALQHEGISTRHAIVDIPRDQAILNTLRLPCAVTDELPDMVEIQVAKELPFPVGEAAIDFIVPPGAAEEATSDVLVAAVRKDVVEQYLNTCQVAGLKLHRIGLRPHANKVSLSALLADAMPTRVLFVDLRPALTEIDVLKDGRLEFSRAASVHIPRTLEDKPRLTIARDEDASEVGEKKKQASPSMFGVEGVINSLLLEVTRSLEAYRAHDSGAQIDQVLIGGDLGIEQVLAEAIHGRLQIPTELFNPAPLFGWSPEEGAAAAAYAASLGLVIGHADETQEHFDFLHPKQAVSATQQKLRKAPLVTAVVILFVGAVAVFVEGATRDDRKKLARLDAEIRELESHRSDNKKFFAIVDEVRSFDEDQQVWVDVLYDLFQCLPSNETLVVDNITMDQKNSRVVIKTRTKQRDTASEAVVALEAYRREGREKPRFKATVGGQTENPRDRYEYTQELTVQILNDEAKARKARKASSKR